MREPIVATALVGLSMMSGEGLVAVVGWGLFAAAVVVVILQVTVIKKLKEDLKYEQKERELLSSRVGEMKVRLDKQQQELMAGATQRLALSREIEGLHQSIALLVSSNEKNMATIGKLVEKYGDV